ncbi:MAG: metallophosphoesterase [Clostridiales bacterium]|nr:metallophosphoesterase [Candidatus Crickella equi]
MWIFLIMLGYLVGCLYATWQLMWWLKRTRWGHKHKLHGIAITLGVIDLIPIFGAFLPQSTFDAYLQKIGNIWLGWVAVFGLCLVVGHIIKHIIHMVSTRQAAVILATMFAITASYNVYGYIHAQHLYTHYYALKMGTNSTELIDEQLIGHDYERIDQDLAYKPQDGEKVTRIALLADMHMGVNTMYSTIEDLVDIVKSSDVDYVIGAGDYFTSSYVGLFGADQYADLLAQMTADGTPAYMAYGNHDVTEPLFCGFAIEDPCNVYRHEDMDKFFERCDWQMLPDKGLDVDGIQFFFRKDKNKTGDGKNVRMDIGEIADSVNHSAPLVVVQHEPEDYDQLATIGADLVLSGHTHDGQIWPGTWFTRAVSDNAHGYKINSGISTIVSSGCGYFGPPLRFGSHGEVVIIDIVR